MSTQSNKNGRGSKPRILVVISNLMVGGGAEKVAAALGNELIRRGFEVHVLTFYESDIKYEFNGPHFTFNELPKNRLQKAFLIPKHLFLIKRYCQENSIDTAISFLEEANFQTLLVKILFLNRLKVIVSVRNSTRSRGWLFRFIMRILYPFSNTVVTVTKSIEQMMIHDFGLNNITTIYNPIDTEEVRSKMQGTVPEDDLWIANRNNLYIHIGRHTKQKGQWHLLRVFSQVVIDNPETALILIGEGEDTDKINAFIIQNGLENNIFVLGKRENVFPYIKVSKALIQTSLWEGMPNVLLEALAVGTPIIVSDCETGPREIIASELPLDAVISYPYKTVYGCLTAPLDHTENYSSVKETPLSHPEIQLMNAIEATMDNQSKKSEHFEDKVQQFNLKNTLNEWEKLL